MAKPATNASVRTPAKYYQKQYVQEMPNVVEQTIREANMQLTIAEQNISVNIPYSKSNINVLVQVILSAKDNFTEPTNQIPPKEIQIEDLIPQKDIQPTLPTEVVQAIRKHRDNGSTILETITLIEKEFNKILHRDTIIQHTPIDTLSSDKDLRIKEKVKNCKISFRAPNHTAQFINWLEVSKITKFTFQQVLDYMPKYISHALLEDIIIHQIQKGNLKQVNANTFVTINQPIPPTRSTPSVLSEVKVTPIIENAIINLCEDGKTADEIRKSINNEYCKNISTTTVYRYMPKKYKLRSGKKPIPDSIKSRINELRSSGKRPKEIIKILEQETGITYGESAIYKYSKTPTQKETPHPIQYATTIPNSTKSRISQLWKENNTLKKIQKIINKETSKLYRLTDIHKYKNYISPTSLTPLSTPKEDKQPEHNSWFLNWIKDSHSKQFSFNDMIVSSPKTITKEHLLVIISYHLEKHNILQIGADYFKYIGK